MSRWIKMEEGYVCPLCMDRKNVIFTRNEILGTPICKKCSYKLWSDVYGHESRPESMLLDRLEELTPLSYEEYCLMEVESVAADLMDTLREYQTEISRLKGIINGRQGKSYTCLFDEGREGEPDGR